MLFLLAICPSCDQLKASIGQKANLLTGRWIWPTQHDPRFSSLQRSLAANGRRLQIADIIARPESDLPAINDQYDQLSTVLRNLSENERSFLLRWINGETMGQISQSVDLSRVRVHQVIAKAIKDIRTNMAARGIA